LKTTTYKNVHQRRFGSEPVMVAGGGTGGGWGARRMTCDGTLKKAAAMASERQGKDR